MRRNPHPTTEQNWRNTKLERPTNIIVPGPSQESVWDYPERPTIERVTTRLQVWFAGVSIADTVQGLRVLQIASPPVYYFSPEDVATAFLSPMLHTTQCEWKGIATYWNISVRGRCQEALGWSYADPEAGYERLKGYFGFYARIADTCHVGLEKAQPQPGDYYGGWITSNIVGPFKGALGTQLW